jgi:hypothetical protein
VYIGLSDHNGIPVENAMPHYIRVGDNQFDFSVSTFDKYELGVAENIWIEGEIVPETDNPNGYPEPAIPRLLQMGANGVLTW